ncbi:MAG: 4Fe-4S binding protein [Calditrichaceae bacterium]|jgi:NAD-dependent dihydropyrimidine dehydrogenase PreA subunit
MKQKHDVIINEAWCKGCKICVEICPKNVLVMDGLIARVDDKDSCTGCMLCEQLCPDFAIIVEPVAVNQE